jgi:hypothetical protein
VRARALRASVFLGSLPCPSGRCAPPPGHRSFPAPLKIKIDYIQKQNVFLQQFKKAPTLFLVKSQYFQNMLTEQDSL